jgi:hypothetical protein
MIQMGKRSDMKLSDAKEEKDERKSKKKSKKRHERFFL